MEDLTLVPMDPADRERLALLARGDTDTLFVMSLISRYDIARSFRDALRDRPERVEGLCDPAGDDEDGYLVEAGRVVALDGRVDLWRADA